MFVADLTKSKNRTVKLSERKRKALLDPLLKINPNIQTDGEFSQAVSNIFEEAEMPELDPVSYGSFKLNPAAYLVAENSNKLVAVEVGVTALGFESLLGYEDLYWALDELEWDLHVVVVRPDGSQHVIDVLEMSMDLSLRLMNDKPKELQ